MIEEHERYDDEFGIDTYIKLRKKDFCKQWSQYINMCSEDYDEGYYYDEIDKLLNKGFSF